MSGRLNISCDDDSMVVRNYPASVFVTNPSSSPRRFKMITVDPPIDSSGPAVPAEKIVCIGPGAFDVLKRNKVIQRGFTKWTDNHRAIIEDALTVHVARTDELENNHLFKQVIPYVMLRRGKDVFWFRRKSKTISGGEGDSRLDGKISIGIGGHWKYGESFVDCITREYSEEIGGMPLPEMVYGDAARHAMAVAKDGNYQLFSNIFPLGIIWDESDRIGRVHIGVLVGIELTTQVTPQPRSDLSACAECGWESMEYLKTTQSSQFESWTRIAINSVLSIE